MKESPPNPEKIIEAYLKAGQTGKAFELVYKLAVFSAKKKNFIKAEAFRDRLYEIDSFALSKIIEVNKVLEVEKSNAILPDDRRLWGKLFEKLELNEANKLLLALKEEVFESDTFIIKQGQRNDKLYFITQGQVKLYYSDQDKELLISRLGRGDIFGGDTFFSLNVCTESVKTLTQVHVKVIDKMGFKKLEASHSTLESNLRKVITSGRSISNRLRQRSIDRRSFRRINWNITILFHLLASKSPKAMERSVKAELWDISKGGLSFYFQSKNREAVQNLIGKRIGVRFDLEVADKVKTIALAGVVHGVQSHPLDEYSVHLKFNRSLSDAAIRAIELNADKT
jgi:CRP-like cAMP-binding protein